MSNHETTSLITSVSSAGITRVSSDMDATTPVLSSDAIKVDKAEYLSVEVSVENTAPEGSSEVSLLHGNVFTTESNGANAEVKAKPLDMKALPVSGGFASSQDLVPITWFWGGNAKDTIALTTSRDFALGRGGADIFKLQLKGALDVSQADVILDYDPAEGDRLVLTNFPYLKTEAELATLISFETIDRNQDAIHDATVIRSIADNSIVAVLPNTVNSQVVGDKVAFQTALSITDFLPLDIGDLESTTDGMYSQSQSSTASASSSAFANSAGAGSNSSVTVIDSNGNITMVTDNAYQAGASSSSASASVKLSPAATVIEAIADAPAVTSHISPPPAFDVVLGTSIADLLVGGDHQDFFMGYDGADIFQLSEITYDVWENSDIIYDFSVLEGDTLQLPSNLKLADISLHIEDINGDLVADGITIRATSSGKVYALIVPESNVSDDTLAAISGSIVASSIP